MRPPLRLSQAKKFNGGLDDWRDVKESLISGPERIKQKLSLMCRCYQDVTSAQPHIPIETKRQMFNILQELTTNSVLLSDFIVFNFFLRHELHFWRTSSNLNDFEVWMSTTRLRGFVGKVAEQFPPGGGAVWRLQGRDLCECSDADGGKGVLIVVWSWSPTCEIETLYWFHNKPTWNLLMSWQTRRIHRNLNLLNRVENIWRCEQIVLPRWHLLFKLKMIRVIDELIDYSCCFKRNYLPWWEFSLWGTAGFSFLWSWSQPVVKSWKSCTKTYISFILISLDTVIFQESFVFQKTSPSTLFRCCFDPISPWVWAVGVE